MVCVPWYSNPPTKYSSAFVGCIAHLVVIHHTTTLRAPISVCLTT